MNRELLAKVIDHLQLQTVYPTAVDAKVASWYDRRQHFNSFTRINWGVSEISAAEIQFGEPGEEEALNLVKFVASTRTRIARIGEGGIPANDQELVDEEVALDLKVEFAVEYLITGCKVDELHEDGMSEYANHNVPYHLWPYYRQFVQDMAQRMQLPVPVMPSFRVPKSHQRET